jgi:hypothetical protein
VRDPADARFALGQLRHLYEQMLNGHVRNVEAAARGLLGPSIEKLERLMDSLPAHQTVNGQIVVVTAPGDWCGNTGKLADGKNCPGCRACS